MYGRSSPKCRQTLDFQVNKKEQYSKILVGRRDIKVLKDARERKKHIKDLQGWS